MTNTYVIIRPFPGSTMKALVLLIAPSAVIVEVTDTEPLLRNTCDLSIKLQGLSLRYNPKPTKTTGKSPTYFTNVQSLGQWKNWPMTCHIEKKKAKSPPKNEKQKTSSHTSIIEFFISQKLLHKT